MDNERRNGSAARSAISTVSLSGEQLRLAWFVTVSIANHLGVKLAGIHQKNPMQQNNEIAENRMKTTLTGVIITIAANAIFIGVAWLLGFIMSEGGGSDSISFFWNHVEAGAHILLRIALIVALVALVAAFLHRVGGLFIEAKHNARRNRTRR